MPNERRYQRQRAELVDELRERGITHEGVLNALGRVPRHRFVEAALRSRAYRDEALPIGLKQTISQPFTVAYQTMLLDPRPDERILEIGTGSGYQAAVLCEMGARVFSIERHRALLERTQ
ncbi:MAG: protein-L-isoaspartate O-methyltransferase family protein, partial [Rhodothermales bacterium]